MVLEPLPRIVGNSAVPIGWVISALCDVILKLFEKRDEVGETVGAHLEVSFLRMVKLQIGLHRNIWPRSFRA